MIALNPFLLLIAATAFCVPARGVFGRSLSTELQSTTTVDTPIPTFTPTSSAELSLSILPSAYETPETQPMTMVDTTVHMFTSMFSAELISNHPTIYQQDLLYPSLQDSAMGYVSTGQPHIGRHLPERKHAAVFQHVRRQDFRSRP
jgi:hypothetical protein